MSDNQSPLGQLIINRIREFYREPTVLFWVDGFPILLAVGLGIAFREQPSERVVVDVQRAERSGEVLSGLEADERFVVSECDEDECRRRLRSGKTAIVVVSGAEELAVEYLFDPTRPESVSWRGARWTTQCKPRTGGSTRCSRPTFTSASRVLGTSIF